MTTSACVNLVLFGRGDPVRLVIGIDKAATRLRYPVFGAVDAIIAMLLHLRPDGPLSAETDLSLVTSLRFAQDSFLHSPLVQTYGNQGPLFTVLGNADENAPTVIFDKVRLILPVESDLTTVASGSRWRWLAAPLEHRDSDSFVEAEDSSEIMGRRRVWTAACLACTDLLPCRPNTFVQAAEIVSMAAKPNLSWHKSEISKTARICAAIRAGIVLYEPREDLLIANPCLKNWQRIISLKRETHAAIATAARHFSSMPYRLTDAVHAWSQQEAGGLQATGHDLVAASQAITRHRAAIDLVNQTIMPKISPLPIPPPNDND